MHDCRKGMACTWGARAQENHLTLSQSFDATLDKGQSHFVIYCPKLGGADGACRDGCTGMCT